MGPGAGVARPCTPFGDPTAVVSLVWVLAGDGAWPGITGPVLSLSPWGKLLYPRGQLPAAWYLGALFASLPVPVSRRQFLGQEGTFVT